MSYHQCLVKMEIKFECPGCEHAISIKIDTTKPKESEIKQMEDLFFDVTKGSTQMALLDELKELMPSKSKQYLEATFDRLEQDIEKAKTRKRLLIKKQELIRLNLRVEKSMKKHFDKRKKKMIELIDKKIKKVKNGKTKSN